MVRFIMPCAGAGFGAHPPRNTAKMAAKYKAW